MKLLLADAPHMFVQKQGTSRHTLPLGLAYIGSFLEAEHDVKILLPDTRPLTDGDPWHILRTTIEAESPEVVGITAVSALYPSAVRLAQEVKQINPEIVTILGGAHATVDPVGAITGDPALDYVVVGEGEETLRDLLREMNRDLQDVNPATIPGLFWVDRSDGKVNHSGYRLPINDLDRLPLPMRSNLVWQEELNDAFYQTMITCRGCAYQCVYCAASTLCRGSVRCRSPKHVVDEMAHLQQHHGISYLFFHDAVFTLQRRRTLELCERIVQHRLGISFNCQTRVEHVDPVLLERMKAAGCAHIFFGIESGCMETLKRIGKQFDLQQVKRAVKMVIGQGIQCSGFFMIGFPWETASMMAATADFAMQLELSSIFLFSATPLPGTRLWDMIDTRQIPTSIDFRWPEINLTRLTDQSYRDLYQHINDQFNAYNEAMMTKRVRDLIPVHP